MTSKEKAEILFKKFREIAEELHDFDVGAMIMAEFCVDELIEATSGFTTDDDFYLQVKDELKKLW